LVCYRCGLALDDGAHLPTRALRIFDEREAIAIGRAHRQRALGTVEDVTRFTRDLDAWLLAHVDLCDVDARDAERTLHRGRDAGHRSSVVSLADRCEVAPRREALDELARPDRGMCDLGAGRGCRRARGLQPERRLAARRDDLDLRARPDDRRDRDAVRTALEESEELGRDAWIFHEPRVAAGPATGLRSHYIERFVTDDAFTRTTKGRERTERVGARRQEACVPDRTIVFVGEDHDGEARIGSKEAFVHADGAADRRERLLESAPGDAELHHAVQGPVERIGVVAYPRPVGGDLVDDERAGDVRAGRLHEPAIALPRTTALPDRADGWCWLIRIERAARAEVRGRNADVQAR
jgi:hypothetical protein